MFTLIRSPYIHRAGHVEIMEEERLWRKERMGWRTGARDMGQSTGGGDGSETGSVTKMKGKKSTTGIGASIMPDSGIKRRATLWRSYIISSQIWQLVVSKRVHYF